METTTPEIVQEVLEAVAKLLASVGLSNYCVIASDGLDNSFTMYQTDSALFVDGCFEAVENLADALENSPLPTLH